MSILHDMLNKAEAWGYGPENTDHCRTVRRNRRRQCGRFLSTAEMARLGRLLTQERRGEYKVEPLVALVEPDCPPMLRGDVPPPDVLRRLYRHPMFRGSLFRRHSGPSHRR
jgi:hypothetical protein